MSCHSCCVLYFRKGFDKCSEDNLSSSPLPLPRTVLFCSVLSRFDDCVDNIRDWLKQMELSLKSDIFLGEERQQGAPDSTEELERMENLNKELLARRYMSLCEGHSTGITTSISC